MGELVNLPRGDGDGWQPAQTDAQAIPQPLVSYPLAELDHRALVLHDVDQAVGLLVERCELAGRYGVEASELVDHICASLGIEIPRVMLRTLQALASAQARSKGLQDA